LANPAVRQAYDAQAPEFELARELIAARTQAVLTQAEVVARMGTTPTQSFFNIISCRIMVTGDSV